MNVDYSRPLNKNTTMPMKRIHNSQSADEEVKVRTVPVEPVQFPDLPRDVPWQDAPEHSSSPELSHSRNTHLLQTGDITGDVLHGDRVLHGQSVALAFHPGPVDDYSCISSEACKDHKDNAP